MCKFLTLEDCTLGNRETAGRCSGPNEPSQRRLNEVPVHRVAALPRGQAELVGEGQHDWTNLEFLMSREKGASSCVCEGEALRVVLGRNAENSGQGEGQWECGPVVGPAALGIEAALESDMGQ